MSFRYSWLMEISMIRNFLLGIGLTGLAMAAGKLELKDLPPAVRKTVEAETKGATIKNIVKEKEKGKTVYEVETMVNGKSRDIVVDSTGALETVEEQADLDSFPAAAKAAILKKIADGKLTMAETLKKGSTLNYEAAYTTKGGKKKEVIVSAEGVEVK